MTHDLILLVLNALAVYRLTRLLVKDTITSSLRRDYRIKRLGVAFHPGDLFGCPWCVSIYTATLVVVLTSVWNDWPYAAAVLAFSAVTGFIAERE